MEKGKKGAKLPIRKNQKSLKISTQNKEAKIINAYRESENIYKKLVEASVQGIVIAQGIPPRLVYANPAFSRILGYSSDELTSLTFEQTQNLIHPDDRSAFFSRYKDRLEGKPVPPNYEVRGIRKDGSAVWLELSATRIEYNGEPAVLATYVDITERKRAEEALRASEERYRAILENIEDGYFEVDLAGNFTFFNDSVCQILGYSRDELMGMNSRQYTDKEDAKKLFQAFNRVFKSGEPTKEFDWEVIKKDGTRRHIDASVSLIKDSSGQPMGFRGIVRDITERKKAEETLLQSEERYRTLVEESFDGIFIQRGFEIIFANRRLYEMLGYDEGELEGIDHYLVYHPDYHALTRERAQARMRGELVPSTYEVKFLRKDGSSFWGEIHAKVISFLGEPGIQVWARDISERKQAEETLRLERERFRSLSESAPFGMAIIDKDGAFKYINPKFKELFGYELSDIPDGKTWFRKAYPDPIYRHHVISAWINDLKSVKPGEKRSRIFSVTCKDRTEKTINFIPVQLATGEHLMTCEDITERKHAEEALRASEERNRNILDNIEDGYYEVDTAGNFTFLNNSLCKIIGYSEEKMMGMNNRVYMDKETARRVYQAYNRVYTTDEPLKAFGYKITRKDGTERFLESHVSLLKNANGERIGFRGIARDMTEGKQAEEALRRSEESSRELAKENAIMAEIGRIISSTLNINEVYERFSEEVNKLIPFDRISINLTNFKDSTVTVAYALGLDVPGRRIGDIFSLAGSVNEYLMKTKSSLLILIRDEKDVQEVRATLPNLLPNIQSGIRSFIAVPLFEKDTVIGVLHIRSLQENAYSEADLKLAERVGNQITGAIVNAQLFTEHKEVEEALRKSEERYRTILESIQDGYFEVDLAGNCTFANDARCRSLGYTKEELIGMNNRQFEDKDNVKKVYQAFNRVYRTGEPVKGLDEKVIRKDGTKAFSEISVSLIRDSEGKPIGFRGISRDITERKQAEEALRRSEESSRNLARENAAMAEIGRIISSTLNIDEVYERFTEEVRKLIPFDRIMINIVNPDKKTVTFAYITGINIAGRQIGDVVPLAGTATEGVMQTRSSLLVQTENIEEVTRRFPGLLPAFQAGLRSGMSVPLFSKDQIIGVLHIRSFNSNAYSERDLGLAERVGHQIAGAIANAQLFKELMQAEEDKIAIQEQFRQSQKMEAIGGLAGGIAHDFNNLLTVIKGYAELSCLGLDTSDPLRGNIEEILKASERATNLTRQLLAFSRRQILDFKVINLNTLLKDLDKMLHRILGEDIDLVYNLPEDIGKVKTDPGQIEQVILNLAVNARDAMPSGGKLTIETLNMELSEAYAQTHMEVTPGQYVMLSVSDSGAGMPPKVRERIFEPFFTTKEKGKGTGLGLSTVYGIVKQSGGNINVYSEPGLGTTFKIYLPRVEEEEDHLQRKDLDISLSTGNETILLTEDEQSVRELAARILRDRGYQVYEAPDGKEALDIAQRHPERKFHLLLTDVVMPGMSGKELADRLKLSMPDIKVLFISGYTDNAIVHHGVLDKGVNFIQKPFTPDSLARKLREVLDR